MQPRYRLHYAPDNASLIIRLVMMELDLAFDNILVDRRIQAQKSHRYRQINPAGLIPALETDQGVIFETGAILLWLCERHDGMAPTPNHPDRGDFLKWLFFVSNTLHPALRMHFYPQSYIESDDAMALRDGCRANLTQSLGLLDTAAQAGHDWLNGKVTSALDIYIAACLRWMALYTNQDSAWFALKDWPALSEICAKLDRRPSVAQASAIEGWQASPFSDPKPVTPAKGTAT